MKNKGKLKFLTTIAGIGAICASTFAIAYEIVKNSISYSSLDNSSSNEFESNNTTFSNDNTASNKKSRLGAQHINDQGNNRFQHFNYASGLIGSYNDNAMVSEKGSKNRRIGGYRSYSPAGSECFMFSTENTWLQSPEEASHFIGAGGYKGDESDIGIPVVINRVDAINTPKLDFVDRFHQTDPKVLKYTGVFKDEDGDDNHGWEGNYDSRYARESVPANLHYYVYSIGDKVTISQFCAFSSLIGNTISGDITLPETCAVIGNYAFNGAKRDGGSTIDIPENIYYMGHHAFADCKFYDINFRQSDFHKIWSGSKPGEGTQIYQFSPTSNTADWKPSLATDPSGGKGYCWFPYDPNTYQVTEDGQTYTVTQIMQAFHDCKNFGFKYSDMRNGSKIVAPSLTADQTSLKVSEETTIHADMDAKGAIDPNDSDNKITWTTSDQSLLFFDETDSSWKTSVVTSGINSDPSQSTSKHSVKVKAVKESSNASTSVIATVVDNHKVSLTSEISITSTYDVVTSFNWENPGDETITVLPSGKNTLDYNILESGSLPGTWYVEGASIAISGNYPTGLTISSATSKVADGIHKCTLSWTSTTALIGTYNFTVTATSNGKGVDGNKITITKNFTLNIKYEDITGFDFSAGGDTLNLIPGESLTEKYTIDETSATGNYEKGIKFELLDIKKDGQAISKPTWLTLSPTDVITPDVGEADKYSTKITCSTLATEGTYTFTIKAIATGVNAAGEHPTAVKNVTLSVMFEPITSMKFNGSTSLTGVAGDSQELTNEYNVEITSANGKFKRGLSVVDILNIKKDGIPSTLADKNLKFTLGSEEAISSGVRYKLTLSIGSELTKGTYTFTLKVKSNGSSSDPSVLTEIEKDVTLEISYAEPTKIVFKDVPTVISATYQKQKATGNFSGTVYPIEYACQELNWALIIPTELQSKLDGHIEIVPSIIGETKNQAYLMVDDQIPVGVYNGIKVEATVNDGSSFKAQTNPITLIVSYQNVKAVSITGQTQISTKAKTATPTPVVYSTKVDPDNANQNIDKMTVKALRYRQSASADWINVTQEESGVHFSFSSSTNAGNVWWSDVISKGEYEITFFATSEGTDESGNKVNSADFTVHLDVSYNAPEELYVEQQLSSATMYAGDELNLDGHDDTHPIPFKAKVDPTKQPGWSDTRVKWSIAKVYNDDTQIMLFPTWLKVDEDTGAVRITENAPYLKGKLLKVFLKAQAIANVSLIVTSTTSLNIEIKATCPDKVDVNVNSEEVAAPVRGQEGTCDWKLSADVSARGSKTSTIQNVEWSIDHVIHDGKHVPTPSWLSMDKNSGLVSWTKDVLPGAYEIYAKATSIYAKTEFAKDVYGVAIKACKMYSDYEKPDHIDVKGGSYSGQGSQGKDGHLNRNFTAIAYDKEGDSKYCDPNIRWEIIMTNSQGQADSSIEIPSWLKIKMSDTGTGATVYWTNASKSGEYYFRIHAISVNYTDVIGESSNSVHLTIVAEDSLLWLWILISVGSVLAVGAGLGIFLGHKHKLSAQKQVAKEF